MIHIRSFLHLFVFLFLIGLFSLPFQNKKKLRHEINKHSRFWRFCSKFVNSGIRIHFSTLKYVSINLYHRFLSHHAMFLHPRHIFQCKSFSFVCYDLISDSVFHFDSLSKVCESWIESFERSFHQKIWIVVVAFFWLPTKLLKNRCYSNLPKMIMIVLLCRVKYFTEENSKCARKA